jgi:hypothetical protein
VHCIHSHTPQPSQHPLLRTLRPTARVPQMRAAFVALALACLLAVAQAGVEIKVNKKGRCWVRCDGASAQAQGPGDHVGGRSRRS